MTYAAAEIVEVSTYAYENQINAYPAGSFRLRSFRRLCYYIP